MQKKTIGKLSALGLVLLAASAVTAAMSPSKANTKAEFNGTLVQQSDDGAGAINTCITREFDPQKAFSCTATAGSLTTVGSANNSYTELGGQTANNTTV